MLVLVGITSFASLFVDRVPKARKAKRLLPCLLSRTSPESVTQSYSTHHVATVVF